MTRPALLSFSSAVAVVVAALALCAPEALLEGKGVAPSPALAVWVREVGVLILATGVTNFLVRKLEASPALRGVLIGNAVLHLGLLPIELVAFTHGTITKLGGVVPNSLLHAVLGVGFAVHAWRMRSVNPVV